MSPSSLRRARVCKGSRHAAQRTAACGRGEHLRAPALWPLRRCAPTARPPTSSTFSGPRPAPPPTRRPRRCVRAGQRLPCRAARSSRGPPPAALGHTVRLLLLTGAAPAARQGRAGPGIFCSGYRATWVLRERSERGKSHAAERSGGTAVLLLRPVARTLFSHPQVAGSKQQEEQLLEAVRAALGAKHVIRVCSSYEQVPPPLPLTLSLLPFAPMLCLPRAGSLPNRALRALTGKSQCTRPFCAIFPFPLGPAPWPASASAAPPLCPPAPSSSGAPGRSPSPQNPSPQTGWPKPLPPSCCRLEMRARSPAPRTRSLPRRSACWRTRR